MRYTILGGLALGLMAIVAPATQAHEHIGVRVGYGVRGYYAPSVYVGAPAVVVAPEVVVPAPVVVAPAPVVVEAAPVVVAPAPVVEVAPVTVGVGLGWYGGHYYHGGRYGGPVRHFR